MLELISFGQRALPESVFSGGGGTEGQEERPDPVSGGGGTEGQEERPDPVQLQLSTEQVRALGCMLQ